MDEDYFRARGSRQRAMRELLEREATLHAPRFGLDRRGFLASAMGTVAASAVWQQMPRFASKAEAQSDFQSPSENCYAEAQAEHAAFQQVGAASALDWELIRASASVQQAAVPETVLNMLRSLATLYSGFGVSQLTHGTQTATRALRSNASDELVLICLVHDIGETITGVNHAEIAGALVRPYVSDDAYRITRHHAEFQLKHYGDKIGQPPDMRERYRDLSWYQHASVMSDVWDQTAFDPDYDTLPLAEFEPLVRKIFSRVPEPKLRTSQDCLVEARGSAREQNTATAMD